MKRVPWPIVIEVAGIFALIMLYIWRLRFTAPWAWTGILALIVLSHVVHRERSASLGFRWNNFRECLETLAPALVLLALAMLASGVLLQTVRNIRLEQALAGLLVYCVWGLFQQYLLNGYFANRLLAVSPGRHVPWISAALFSGTHLPNWFLMLVTFAFGYCSTRIYMKYRNVYFLGLAHGLIGTLLFIVVPDSISHHLTVGPGFYLR
jgi:Type II CAAX prenyl endopeptidase Rce1-like